MKKCLLVALNAKYIHSNPGVYSLKAYAESSGDRTLCGIQIQIAEYTINNQMEQVLEDIYKRKPDIIGFSCYIWNIKAVLEIITDLRKVLPNVHIWMGGPEVSYDAVKQLEEHPDVLGIMKSEGEESFYQLLKAYEGANDRGVWEKELEQIPSLTYRKENTEIIDNPIRPVMNMDEIPFLYQNFDLFEHRIIYYESSRGCPYSCSYCLSSVDKSVRFRSVELVKKELGFFLEKKIPQVKFVDRTFNCKKSHSLEIWNYILEHDNGITNFHFEIAADLLNEEELKLLAKMRPGLVQLEIGVQSTNPDTIQEIRRVMDVEALGKIVERIRKNNNIHQHLDLIAGLPYETYTLFQQSFNRVFAMKPDQLQLGFLKVLKGSYMFEKQKDYGIQAHHLPPYEVLSTRWLDFDEVIHLKSVENMVEIYYNSGQYTTILELVIKMFPTPFEFFSQLAKYFEANGKQYMSHSRITKYQIIYEFILNTLPIEKAQIEDALMIDLYLRENCKSRPDFAPDQHRFKEQIKKQIPNLRTLGSNIHVEVLQSGKMVVFDYRKRDPLSGNATLWQEEEYESICSH